MNEPSDASPYPNVASLISPSVVRRAGLDQARCEVLLNRLSSAADALARRRAAEIAEPDVTDYVGLGWMRWNGGRIDLTELGQNLVRSMNLYQVARTDEQDADEPPPAPAAEAPAAAPPTTPAATRAHALKHRVADLVKRREKHRRALANNARSRGVSRP